MFEKACGMHELKNIILEANLHLAQNFFAFISWEKETMYYYIINTKKAQLLKDVALMPIFPSVLQTFPELASLRFLVKLLFIFKQLQNKKKTGREPLPCL